MVLFNRSSVLRAVGVQGRSIPAETGVFSSGLAGPGLSGPGVAPRYNHQVLEREQLTLFARYVLLMALLALPAGAAAQTGTASPATPTTPWGDPDLQGIWDYRTMTPLQRPRDLADKDVFTAEEAAAYEQTELETRADYDERPTVHAKLWLDYATELTADRRTSLIVDPRMDACPLGPTPRFGPTSDSARTQHS